MHATQTTSDGHRDDSRISCRQPADRWEDALPTGNGTVGALVFGNIADEHVVVNHAALWYPEPELASPDLARVMPTVKDLVLKSRFDQGRTTLTDELAAQGYPHRLCLSQSGNPYAPHAANIAPSHPAFDIRIRHRPTAPFTWYRRELDLSSGEIVVRWRSTAGEWVRRLFVSDTDDLLVMELTCPAEETLTATVELEPHHAPDRSWSRLADTRKVHEPPISFLVNARDSADRCELDLIGSYHAGGYYGGVARVVTTGGTLQADGRAAACTDTSRILVMLKLFAFESPTAAKERLRSELEALPTDYQALFARHAGSRRQVLSQVGLRLGPADTSASRCIEDLMARVYDGESLSLLHERMFEYGRHLLYSSSRGKYPAHHFGIWNGDYFPGFFTQRTHDINFEQLYWPALPGGLESTLTAYFAYIESMLDDWRENARRVHGCDGVVGNLYGTTHGRINPVIVAEVVWTGAAGWLAQLFFDYYSFTGDREFLANRVLPLLEEVARFYADFVTDGPDGEVLFAPSWSPENWPSHTPTDAPEAQAGNVVVNATLDVAIAREVLSRLCFIYTELGTPDKAVKWEELLGRLPAYQINEEGAMREWLYPGLGENHDHRHVSHLYPVYPGCEISAESAPELVEAARTTLAQRWSHGTGAMCGWSYPHFACLFARLEDGNRALECLELLLRSAVGPNLFVYHNDWRNQGVTMSFGTGRDTVFIHLDGNTGYTAAVHEMLVQSRGGFISILPALPDAWPSGAISGVRCRGGLTASVEWTPVHIQFTLHSFSEQRLTVKLPTLVSGVTSSSVLVESHDLGSRYRSVMLPAGRSIDFTATIG